MSFNRLIAEADPMDAARAAIIMAKSVLASDDASEPAHAVAQRVLNLTEVDLADRIRASRSSESLAVEVVIAAMAVHHPSATQICIGCDWDGDYYQNPDGSGSQPAGADKKHQAEAIVAALKAAGFGLGET